MPIVTSRELGLGLLVASAATACGVGAGAPARFSGLRGDARLAPAEVQQATQVPAGLTTLGRVTATCRFGARAAEVEDEALGDVECSADALREELRETAAAVGGEALVGVSCSPDPDPAAHDDVRVACSAAVAGRRSRPVVSSHAGAMTADDAYTSDAEAWRIRVTVRRDDRAGYARPPRATDRVAERPFVPVSHHVVGDVLARCDGECGRRAVREAVRAGAGRVGATDVVGVACVRDPSGWLCTGRAARPELDYEREVWTR